MAKTTLNLRIDAELKEQASEAAKASRRSLTSLIEFLLDEYVKDQKRGRK